MMVEALRYLSQVRAELLFLKALVGIAREKKSLGAEPLEKQEQVARSQGASMLRKGLGVTTQFGSSVGAGQYMEVFLGDTVCGGDLAHGWLSSS
jgi:hypothetical protein